MYYLAGTSGEPPQPSLKELNVRNRFSWFAFTSFKFPEVGKLWLQKVWIPKNVCVWEGVGGGERNDDTHTS